MARKVVVIGGGIAGLTAAYELSRTESLRAKWDVEVVEMGHRWGGRLASAHHPDRFGRNEEHGLHVWFGFYENTFRLAEQVWADFDRPEDCPWEQVWDGLRPIFHSDHGLEFDDEIEVRRVFYPRNADRPGSGDLPSLDALFAALTDLPRSTLSTVFSVLMGRELPSPERSGFWAMRQPRRVAALAERLLRSLPSPAVGRRARLAGAEQLERAVAKVHRPIVAAALRAAGRDPGRRSAVHIMDMAFALLRGMCSVEHRLLDDGDFDRISAWEFRDWLRYHGLSADTDRHGRFLHAIYDIPFAFREGRPDAPVMEASTALRYTLRIVFGYRHAPAYLLNAGAGETLVAPLYALLRKRGVRFTPFHRLERVQIDPADARITSLEFTRVARERTHYDPLIARRGFLSLLGEPDWAQLEQGEDLAERGVDFYSRFGDRGEQAPVRWQVGERFDDVILALPLGSIKPDADGHSPVADWLAYHPPARQCLDRLHLVPTVAAQVWLKTPVAETPLHRRAVVTWAQPYSVVCDMTPVVEHETWPGAGPGSCAYMCGAAPLTAQRQRCGDAEAPARDRAYAKQALRHQLDRYGDSLFGPQWSLFDAARADGDGDEAQYVRANVEPWDLADLPLPGANAVRLEASDTGLVNLSLAGTWVRNTVNTTSLEAAVWTGIAAARALGADTQKILTERLFRRAAPSPVLAGREEEVRDGEAREELRQAS